MPDLYPGGSYLVVCLCTVRLVKRQEKKVGHLCEAQWGIHLHLSTGMMGCRTIFSSSIFLIYFLPSTFRVTHGRIFVKMIDYSMWTGVRK